MNPEVYPKSIRVVQDKETRFTVSYSCKQLLSKNDGKEYYDTVKVTVSDSIDSISFDYIIVCSVESLKGLDINFLVLFGIAIGIVVLSIKTPPLLIFKDMTEDE